MLNSNNPNPAINSLYLTPLKLPNFLNLQTNETLETSTNKQAIESNFINNFILSDEFKPKSAITDSTKDSDYKTSTIQNKLNIIYELRTLSDEIKYFTESLKLDYIKHIDRIRNEMQCDLRNLENKLIRSKSEIDRKDLDKGFACIFKKLNNLAQISSKDANTCVVSPFNSDEI